MGLPLRSDTASAVTPKVRPKAKDVAPRSSLQRSMFEPVAAKGLSPCVDHTDDAHDKTRSAYYLPTTNQVPSLPQELKDMIWEKLAIREVTAMRLACKELHEQMQPYFKRLAFTEVSISFATEHLANLCRFVKDGAYAQQVKTLRIYSKGQQKPRWCSEIRGLTFTMNWLVVRMRNLSEIVIVGEDFERSSSQSFSMTKLSRCWQLGVVMHVTCTATTSIKTLDIESIRLRQLPADQSAETGDDRVRMTIDARDCQMVRLRDLDGIRCGIWFPVDLDDPTDACMGVLLQS